MPPQIASKLTRDIASQSVRLVHVRRAAVDLGGRGADERSQIRATLDELEVTVTTHLLLGVLVRLVLIRLYGLVSVVGGQIDVALRTGRIGLPVLAQKLHIKLRAWQDAMLLQVLDSEEAQTWSWGTQSLNIVRVARHCESLRGLQRDMGCNALQWFLMFSIWLGLMRWNAKLENCEFKQLL